MDVASSHVPGRVTEKESSLALSSSSSGSSGSLVVAARDLTPDNLDGRPVDLVVADLSFISLTKFLDTFAEVTAPDGTWLLMVKPQFEVGRDALGKDGVVRDPALRVQAVRAVVAAAEPLGWHPRATAPSRLPGPAGNAEVFVHLSRTPHVGPGRTWDASLC